ncbi:MAG: hypothetical protein M3Q44_05360 [bacterium]|nr:hypothetical protein [bacterium]
MAEQLDFVPKLGTANEVIPNVVFPGTHVACILGECLRPLDRFADSGDERKPDVLFCSFPSLLPDYAQRYVDGAKALFVRGEFLAVRAFGNRAVRLPLSEFDQDLFDRSTHDVISARPPTVYYRMVDYNPDEFEYLEDTPDNGLRGSGRLLHDDRLLAHELRVIEAFMAGGKDVCVVLPYMTTPYEHEQIAAVVREVRPNQIGVMVERVAHIRQIRDYPLCDFVFPGPSDLTADFNNIARGAYRHGVGEAPVVELCQQLAVDAASLGIPDYIACKILVNSITAQKGQIVRRAYMASQLALNI